MDETVKACHIACLANLGDVAACTDYCKTCVEENSCFTGTEYKPADYMDCYDECRSDCIATLGAGSTFCDCDAHGECVFGCPGNCDSMDEDVARCLVNCITATLDPVACDALCETCVTELGCWTDIEYAITDDFDCFN